VVAKHFKALLLHRLIRSYCHWSVM